MYICAAALKLNSPNKRRWGQPLISLNVTFLGLAGIQLVTRVFL